ncbi:hypothetical protein AcetOrient_orf00354 [Acetobacter orientalis]|uniref:Uncharacterized protein n=1 Tax=Acetobacter orientalis TaxID=146474 RepID=A0A2Z5ZDC0_9PROT|nr:hypothetical protein AcetOrient_orf00354 [Acetobacter orientalis]
MLLCADTRKLHDRNGPALVVYICNLTIHEIDMLYFSGVFCGCYAFLVCQEMNRRKE